jgi:LysR family transcriptional activator of nhaA
MNWLNYHHLFYFWTVAREGSLTEGSRKLHLTPQTVSTQLRTLEAALGEELFDRSGRQFSLRWARWCTATHRRYSCWGES